MNRKMYLILMMLVTAALVLPAVVMAQESDIDCDTQVDHQVATVTVCNVGVAPDFSRPPDSGLPPDFSTPPDSGAPPEFVPEPVEVDGADTVTVEHTVDSGIPAPEIPPARVVINVCPRCPREDR